MTLALAEPGATAVLLAVFGVLMAFCVLFARPMNRAGVPIVLLFLVLGMLGGSEGIGGIAFDNHGTAFRLGTIALVLILIDGGLNTSVRAIRASLGPSGVLATVGVAGTAAALALVARAMGLSWQVALLIGAIVSSTDAAAVFAVLRAGSIRLKDRVRNVLEVEACANDPMAVILTVAVIDAVSAGRPPGWGLLLEVPLQLAIGGAAGVAIGYVWRFLLARVQVSAGGLLPVVTLAAGFVAFGAATLAHGSGFLAAFAAAVVLGNGPLPYRTGIARVHDALAWLSQVAMFLMLGLLVFPSKLVPVAGIGLALGLALAVVARPLAVAVCLLPFGFSWRESLCIGWVGLRGAVPIILATFPVMAGLPDADEVFHVVFFIVVISTLVPGASIVPIARRLKLDEPEPPAPAAAIEMHSLRQLNGEVKAYYIDPTLAVCGATLSQVRFPEGAAAVLIVRGNELVAARGSTRLLEGDYVHVFCKPEDEPYISLLFGRPSD